MGILTCSRVSWHTAWLHSVFEDNLLLPYQLSSQLLLLMHCPVVLSCAALS